MRIRRLLIPWIITVTVWLVVATTPGAAQPPPPDPRFGVVEAFVNAEAATEVGAGYSRIILRWDLIQPASAVDWKPANVPDPFIETELAAGRQVVVMLMGTPAWATADGSGSPKAVPDMAYWEQFVQRIAQQYQGRIYHWIIWNEPDVWDMDHPGSTWAGTEVDYYWLLRTAYLAIKDVDPSMQVHMAGLTYFWDQQHDRRQYLDRLLDIILADPEAPAHGYYFDAVVYHLYYKPLQAPVIIGEVQGILGGRGIMAKGIWINETNAPPSEDEQEPPRQTPPFRVSLEEQSAFVIQEFCLAFAAGADRVEFNKMRNSAEYPEDVVPYGMLRADDSRRPVFDAYQVMTTYLRDFRAVQWERSGDVYAVTFDRGGTTTTVLWNMNRLPIRFTVNAIAPQATLVDESGNTETLTATEGEYAIDLPGALCTEAADCFVGGAPRLLVEAGSPGARSGLMPVVVPTPTPPSEETHEAVIIPTQTVVPASTAVPVPTQPATPTPTPTSVAIAEDASVAQPPQPLPTPLPPITLISILTPTRYLILGLVGLAVFTLAYGLQMAIWRRWKP